MRYCGAFFLRRSFRGDTLYSTVFGEYLHHLQRHGVPLEYFIEGGRSRTGFTLPPKTGLLAMSIASFAREHRRPLVFVPVYIGYEKLFEAESYLRELSGLPKEKESLRGLLQTLRRLRKIYGTVHVNFGEPLDLAAFLEVHRPDWRSTPPESLPAWSREVAHRLAAELARRIDEAAVVGPINLIALAMRDAPAQGLTAAALHERIAHDLALLRPFSPVCVMTSLNEAQIIARAERLGHIEKRGERFCLPAGQAARLAYFRNNVLHLVRQDRPIGPSGEKAVIPGL